MLVFFAKSRFCLKPKDILRKAKFVQKAEIDFKKKLKIRSTKWNAKWKQKVQKPEADVEN